MTLNQALCFFISNYSVRCFADEIPATLEILLHGGTFAGSAPVQPTRCERDHISKVHQLIMNTFTRPVLIVYLFSWRCRPFLCAAAASALKQLFYQVDNELQVIPHMIGLFYEVVLLKKWIFIKECEEQQCKVIVFLKRMTANGWIVPGLAQFGGHRSPEAVAILYSEQRKYGRGLRFTLHLSPFAQEQCWLQLTSPPL